MIDIGHSLITAILAVISLVIYNGIFFKQYKKFKSALFLWLLFFIWQFLLSNYDILPSYGNIVVSIVLILLINTFEYQGNMVQKLVSSFLITAMWILMEFLVGYVLTLIGGEYGIPVFWRSIISKSLILILVNILKRFFKNENIQNLSIMYNIFLMAIPVGSMYVLFNMFMISIDIRQCIFSSIIILVNNIIIFQFCSNVLKVKGVERHNAVSEQLIELYTCHIHDKERLLMELRNERHNIKQHFYVLNSLLENSKDKEALLYIDKLINKTVAGEMGVCRTENVIVDSIINSKYSLAHSKGITLEVDVHIPMQLIIENADLIILLGNILDNAIEATEQLTSEEKLVRFYMKYDQNTLIITEINEYSGSMPITKNGRMLSRTGDNINHGIGLASIREIAEKYHGAVIIKTENHVFEIRVTLCEMEGLSSRHALYAD